MLAQQHAVADKLVLHKVRARFGGRIRFFISGSAALNQDIADAGSTAVGLVDPRGLRPHRDQRRRRSSTARPATRSAPSGWALPGTEVQIAEDGEVLLRGPGVMEGYHNKPEDTAETKDADGWLHTGDIGELDDSGYLRITDRKKDFFKTSRRQVRRAVADRVDVQGHVPLRQPVHGLRRRPQLRHGPGHPRPRRHHGVGRPARRGRRSTARSSPPTEARDMVQGYVDNLNVNLNRWEQIKKFTILDHDLTIEEGDLTPSLKLRRKAVEREVHRRRWTRSTPAEVRGPASGALQRRVGDEGHEAVPPVLLDRRRVLACHHPQHPPRDRDDEHPVRRRAARPARRQGWRLRRHEDPVDRVRMPGGPSSRARPLRRGAHGIPAAARLAAPKLDEVGTRSTPGDPTRRAGQVGEQGGGPAGPGADVEDAVAGLDVEQLQHLSDRGGLAVGLAVADRERRVAPAVGSLGGRQETLARQRLHRRSHSFGRARHGSSIAGWGRSVLRGLAC